MSYAANGEKVFLYQDPRLPDCTPAAPRRSDHRLKRFQSTLDKRAWSFCQEVRSRHFHDLMTGSQTCLNTDECHKYVPLEDLISILMSEKDELTKRLQGRSRRPGTSRVQADTDDKEPGGVEDTDSLRKKIAGLTEEVNKSRDTLRKAMHKLQNIDEIMNENKNLQCRLRCSEERVKCLEEKKKHLESELADLRTKSQIQIDLEKAQRMLSMITNQREESTETDEAALQRLALERDQLQEKVKNLEKELQKSKKKEAEIEMLKKQSQSESLDIEEMSRENECYKKKLASMKCLEKQIQELKKQGRALADKYRREAEKAAEQRNKMSQASKELQGLRQERDSLRKRVNELSSYECQYSNLQRKLQRVDAVIAENENLNCKLLALKKLEEENEYLRCRLEAAQEAEMNAAGDKERIMQLQCAVADQEEEMKDLLCQIERLTSGRHEEELERLKCELYEKSSKLKLCEEQLAEIPMLEAEIDELRMKLQCCCREFPEEKRGENGSQKMEVRFPATSTGIQVKYKNTGEKSSSVIGIRREERVEAKHGSCQEILQADSEYKVTSEFGQKKDVMSCEEVQSLLQSSKGIISCVLEDMTEHQKEMEELEMCNRSMREEVETLKSKVRDSDKDCFEEINHSKKALEEKDAEICILQETVVNARNIEDVDTIRELNKQMKVELAAACEGLKQVANLEKMLEKEHEARCKAESRLRSEGQSRAAEIGRVSEDPDFDCCKFLQKETNDLKLQISALNKLTEELKKENELLRELQRPCPDFSKELEEKCALENLLSLLQAELDAFKGQKLSEECEALRNELKRVMEQNCQLKQLVDCYRQRLDAERKSNELNQMKLGGGTPREPIEAERGVTSSFKPGEDEKSKEAKKKFEGGIDGGGMNTKEMNAEEMNAEGMNAEGMNAGGINAEGMNAEGMNAGGMNAEGMDAEGMNAEGMNAGGIHAEGMNAEGMNAEGMNAEGMNAEGMNAEGMNAEGMNAEGMNAGGMNAGGTNTGGMNAGGMNAEGMDAEGTNAGGMKAEGMNAAGMNAGGINKGGMNTEGMNAGGMNAGGTNTGGMNAAVMKAAAAAEAAEKEKADCQKELEELRKQKNELTEQLRIRTQGGMSEKEREDLLRQIKELKKEREDLLRQIEELNAGGVNTGGMNAGGVNTGGMSTGGMKAEGMNAAGMNAGGINKGGMNTGGMNTEGMNAGGVNTEGINAGRVNAGGVSAGGVDAGGMSTRGINGGGMNVGGMNTERMSTGGMNTEGMNAGGMNAGGTNTGGMNAAVMNAAAAAEAAEKEKADCQKELEELRKQKNELTEQLRIRTQGGMSEEEREDLLRQIEELKKEREDLPRQREELKKESKEMEAGNPEYLRERLRKMEAENAEKLKKLMEQHAKELSNQEKIYKENLNSMKAGYETDIRKLAERHKQSITRLQKLHDDEVQEANMNYETQMETMQTQSERAINDVAKGSAAKARKLSEQHTKDLKDMEKKYNMVMEEKNSEHLQEIDGLRSSLTKSMQELELLKKKAKLGEEGSAEKLKAMQARALQKVRRASKQKLDVMKGHLEKERKEAEAEMESLKKQLKVSGVCECKFSRKKPPKPKDPSCPLDFNEVLEKILEEGLDSLTFNEIALVHSKACCALEGIVMKWNSGLVLELEPPIGNECPHAPLLEADKQQLLSRIFDLENAILQRQRQTQEALINMEVAIKRERCRLQGLRNSLENEQQKNIELERLLSSQTKVQADLKRERDKLGNQASLHESLCQEKSRRLDEEVKRKKCLEAEVENLRNKLKQLGMGRDLQRAAREDPCQGPQGPQGSPVELMRLKLEQSMHRERRLALQLENESKCRMQLQSQLQALRQSLKHKVESVDKFSQNPLEAKSAKERKNLDKISEKRNKIKTKPHKNNKKR